MSNKDLQWVLTETQMVPSAPGNYRVMIAGDSETDGPHVYYDYPDFETWGEWFPANEEEFENFEGGYKGSWHLLHEIEGESVFAYCGPVELPLTYEEWKKSNP